MSRITESSRRHDAVWILIPLVMPVGLFALGRVPAAQPDRLLKWLAALLLIPAGALLMNLAILRRNCGMWCADQPLAPARVLKNMALLLMLSLGILCLGRSTAPLQVLFLATFAALLFGTWVRASLPDGDWCNITLGRTSWLDYLALTKPGLNAMVLVSVVMGFYLGSPGPLGWGRLACTLAGVGLLAGASATFNQFAERAQDSRMLRTARRPLPSGRVAAQAAVRFGAALALAGMAILALTVNLATAWLATFSFAIYLILYTPLKRRVDLATLAGAVSGALPPLLGWFGAGGALTPGVLVLFGTLYLWQIPHFLAIVWKYREQYRAAGFRLYGVLDESGGATGLQALLYATALLPVSLMMAWHGLAGPAYLMGAFALGISLIVFCVAFAAHPAPGPTRRLFIATIAYLPLLLLFMVLDKWLG